MELEFSSSNVAPISLRTVRRIVRKDQITGNVTARHRCASYVLHHCHFISARNTSFGSRTTINTQRAL